MLIKLKEKIQVIYWNLLFIVLGVFLISIMHGYLSQLARFSMDEVNLLEEVGQEKEEQRRGATKITRSGRTIVQSYTLGLDYEQKQTEGMVNIVLIGLLLLILPFILIVVYTLLQQFSTLAVNRTLCMWIISIMSIVGVFMFEFNAFIQNGNGVVFMLSATSILVIMFFSLFISMQPKELTSPYYRSKTELNEDMQLAA